MRRRMLNRPATPCPGKVPCAARSRRLPALETQMADNTEPGRGRRPGCPRPAAVRGRRPDLACARKHPPPAEIGPHSAAVGVSRPFSATCARFFLAGQALMV